MIALLYRSEITVRAAATEFGNLNTVEASASGKRPSGTHTKGKAAVVT